jgi:hypothetical protein
MANRSIRIRFTNFASTAAHAAGIQREHQSMATLRRIVRRHWFTRYAACAVIALLAARFELAARGGPVESPTSIDALRRERLDVAKKWYAVINTHFRGGTADTSKFETPSLAWKDAVYGLARNKQERIAALAAYRDRSDFVFQVVSAQHKAAAAGLADKLEAESHLLDAKIWLAEEETKP